ncbi:Wdr90 [Symbiodinium pilosum]|uniref:Wdr90 protein n=1 Tax=Symbiodinium pilosum TaxID=2952 RepID=A0A812IQ17_SYMPI|nr:Wdr90 [Symbiodinium pilosum]
MFTSSCCGPLRSIHLADTGDAPWPLLYASADKLLRIARVAAREETEDASASAYAVDLEQSFIAHAEAPHQLSFLSGHAISVSSSEIVCWELAPRGDAATAVA